MNEKWEEFLGKGEGLLENIWILKHYGDTIDRMVIQGKRMW